MHLFHYADLWANLDAEMRRVTAAIDVPIDEARWPEFVQAATLKEMRARPQSAPEANMGLWQSPESFFRVGGSREWASLLDFGDIEHFEQRLRQLAGDATGWVVSGQRAVS